MLRQRLENMSLEELKEEARLRGFRPLSDKNQCIERIITQASRIELENQTLMDQTESSSAVNNFQVLTEPENIIQESQENSQSDSSLQTGSSEKTISQLYAMLSEQLHSQQQQQMLIQQQMFQQNTIMQQMIATLNINRDNSHSSIPSLGSQNCVQRSSDRHFFSSISPAQAVKLLSSQLPEFGGTDDEDVEMWMQKVVNVSEIHQVSEEITLLAATDKLVKTARRWFDFSTGTVNRSWPCFKDAIIRRFKRKILFHVVMQKVEARTWNYIKESFQEYAMDKLALMHNLKLSEIDCIHLLIDGINNGALKATAVSLNLSSIDEFLDQMHNITISFSSRKSIPTGNKSPKEKRKFNLNSSISRIVTNISDDSLKEVQSQDNHCTYCRLKGHLRADCYKLKKKDQTQFSTTSKSSSSSVSAVIEELPISSTSLSSVAAVDFQANKEIMLSDSELNVIILNNFHCNLSALIDTGSPISFICPSVYKKYFNIPISFCSENKKKFTAINGTSIQIIGSIFTGLTLEK